ncbi:MAG: biotin/lipoyl-binding protein [Cytophagales bacterium]|nr:biotin/lipoyl-binding protein [Cytophagales bacterium]
MTNEELETFRVYIAEYKTKLTRKFKARKKWTPPNKNHVLAVIPGTILDILVKNGQKVKEGETLLILEAMKMANKITMPHTGTIAAINVQKGDVVSKNQVMIELEE